MLRFVGAPLVRQASALAFQQRSFVRPLMGGAFSSSALTFPRSGGLQLSTPARTGVRFLTTDNTDSDAAAAPKIPKMELYSTESFERLGPSEGLSGT